MIECSLCPHSCCHDIMGGQTLESPEHQACVTIPQEMIQEKRPFVCPSCLSVYQPRTIDVSALPRFCLSQANKEHSM